MQPPDITFTGPEIADSELLESLDEAHAALLRERNGFIAFNGGLHVRGLCDEPRWHSLAEAWHGESAYHRFYPELTSDDIPFAQDAFGDQYLLRNGYVIRLSAEDGDVVELGVRIDEFIEHASADPGEFLSLGLLDAFREDGGELKPGQLLEIHPPAVSEEATHGVRLRAVSARERFVYLVNLAHMIRQLPRE